MEKPKKERTEAQKKATASMLNKLKENREKGVSKSGRKKKEVKNVMEVDIPVSDSDDEPEPVVTAPKEKVVIREVIKEVPVEPKYLTRDDLHAFKNELASMINPPNAPVQERNVKKSKKVRTYTEDEDEEQQQQQPKAPYEPIRTIIPVAKPQPTLTGYSLLDKLLNR